MKKITVNIAVMVYFALAVIIASIVTSCASSHKCTTGIGCDAYGYVDQQPKDSDNS